MYVMIFIINQQSFIQRMLILLRTNRSLKVLHYLSFLLAFPSKSWNFEVQQSPISQSAYWFNEEGVYLPMSHSNRNIAHFTEVFNFVYHYLHHKSVYPPIHSLFFLQYQKDVVYPWILSYIEATKSLFTTEELFKTYFLEDLWKLDENGMICFKKAV